MKYLNIIIASTVLILTIFVLSSSSNDGQIDYSVKKNDTIQQIIKPPKKKKAYYFAGEKIPIENPNIWERLDRELTVNSYYHSSTIQNIKLANRYFPVIEKILKKNKVPDDFKYLAVAESGLRNVVSKAGATGYWQIMKTLGKSLNLEIYDEVDERYDIVKSTEAACKHLLKLKEKYGTWVDAAAAYNLGMTKYSEALDLEKEKSYFNLNLNEETMRYLFRIVALKEILTHPEEYGFYIDKKDKYKPLDDFYEVKVDTTINSLGDFAHKHNVSYGVLKFYNPWLRSHKLTVKNNKYVIKIPKR